MVRRAWVRRSSFLFLLLAACGSGGDKPVTPDPNPLGDGMRIRQVQAPGPMPPSSPLANATVRVTSAVVTAIDTFDETRDGKSRGTIYLQDLDKNDPLSGISLFSPSFQPANLRLLAGDVVDVNGQYAEAHTIGSTVDFKANFLAQFVQPTVTFRTETTQLPKPVVIDITDLFDPANGFAKARRWMGMLVTVTNLQTYGPPTMNVDKTGKPTGRVTAPLSPDPKNGPMVSNELWNLPEGYWPDGATLKSVTGVVTFFFNFKIAPRSEADIVK